MAEELDVKEVAEIMYKMVADAQGKKKLKAMDLIKGVQEMHGVDGCPKPLGKKAIKELINSGRCVYTYFGGSYVELPHAEGAAGGNE
jgi:hypothetical protein